MSTPNPYESIVRFSTFELDFSGRVLQKSGSRIRCQEQPMRVLAALLEKPGVLITREELRKRVWPEETFVDFDHALNTAVKKLRNVLSDDAGAPQYIETVPRRGYRFIGKIHLPTAVVATDSSRRAYWRAVLVFALGAILAFVVMYWVHFIHFVARELVALCHS
jgi:DNA-binding winged helix-turn-helix (wHTH) protein